MSRPRKQLGMSPDAFNVEPVLDEIGLGVTARVVGAPNCLLGKRQVLNQG